MKVVSSIKNKFLINFLLFIIVIILSTICINIFIYLFKSKFYVKEFNDSIELNYKDEFINDVGVVCYGNKIKCKNVDVSVEGDIDSNKISNYELTYTYKYKNKEKKLKQTVYVVDKEAPIIDVNDTNIKVCPNGKYNKLKYSVSDNYDGDLTDKVKEVVEDNTIFLSVTDSNNNTTTKEIKVNKNDDEGPKITINGPGIVYVKLNSEYKDKGAKAIDNCDSDVNIKTDSNVNTSKEGKYTVTYTAIDSSNNKTVKKRTVYVKEEPVKSTDKIKDKNTKGSKIIYLTFDDGPSIYTSQLLDILKKYDVKATFFVTGNGSDNIILRAYKEGHTIGLHTNNHKYNKVYSSVENYYKDLYAIRDRVKKITGYESTIIRFPGGSSNTISKKYDGGKKIMTFLSKDVQEKGFYYFDWNVDSQDAYNAITANAVYKNVVTSLKSDISIVLQHDTKKYSVEAVEKIIIFGLENGYTFETLKEDSFGAHHRINN